MLGVADCRSNACTFGLTGERGKFWCVVLVDFENTWWRRGWHRVESSIRGVVFGAGLIYFVGRGATMAPRGYVFLMLECFDLFRHEFELFLKFGDFRVLFSSDFLSN